MTTAEKIETLEKILARTTGEEYVLMAGPQQLWGVDGDGQQRFLHIRNPYISGTVAVYPQKLARRIQEWAGGELVQYRTFLQFEINRLKR